MSRINDLIEDAKMVQSKSGHFFGLGTNVSRSPKKSKAGQWYMECVICGRCLFEGRTGSALGSMGCEK